MAFLIKANRTTQIVNAGDLPASQGRRGEFDLSVIQSFVGGYIEHIFLSPPLVIDGREYTHLICDEDGKMKGYPTNYIANNYLLGTRLASHDCIVGDVLLLEEHEIS